MKDKSIFLIFALTAIAAMVFLKAIGAHRLLFVLPAVAFGAYYAQALVASGYITKVVVKMMNLIRHLRDRI